MRLLLTGADGNVGWVLREALAPCGEVVALGRAGLDLADLGAVARAVREAKPAVIVNAAAYTAVDRAESEPAMAMRVNGEAPGVLAEEAKRAGALLVHYSTDYVFDGGKDGPYTEDDAPAPLSAYGRSKLAGERAVQAAGGRHLILRAAWIYGPRGRNFFVAIARKLAAGEALRVVDDQRGTPTACDYVAQATARALAMPAVPEGLYHLAPRGETTWFGFAQRIAAALRPGARVAPIATRDYGAPAPRPRNSVLDATRLARALGAEAPPWDRLLPPCVAAWSAAQPHAAHG